MVHFLSRSVVASSNAPLVFAFVRVSDHRGIPIAWIRRCRFSTLNAFKGVVAVHGDKDAEMKRSFFCKFVCTSRTGMMKPPTCIITAESDLDSLIHMEMDGKEDIIAYGELLAEV